MNPAYKYSATISRVIDGDTIEAVIDLGFHCRITEQFRLARINALEMPTPVSKDALQKLLAGAQKDNVPVTIQSIKPEKGRRWLAEIYVDGKNVSDWLLINGFAKETK